MNLREFFYIEEQCFQRSDRVTVFVELFRFLWSGVSILHGFDEGIDKGSAFILILKC